MRETSGHVRTLSIRGFETASSMPRRLIRFRRFSTAKHRFHLPVGGRVSQPTEHENQFFLNTILTARP